MKRDFEHRYFISFSELIMSEIYRVRFVISSHHILKQLATELEIKNTNTFPSQDNMELIHINFRTIYRLDKITKEVVIVKGFRDLRMGLLKILFRYSQKAPVAYIERELEGSKIIESVILVKNNRNIFEIHKTNNAIAELFRSGLITISKELEGYIGQGGPDPATLINFRVFEAKWGNRKFIIEEESTDLGLMMYGLESDGKCFYDSPQESMEACKTFAKEQFNVPADAWKEVKDK